MPAYETVVGIDLGTTFSAIAHIDPSGNPQIIPNLDNERTTPSVIHVEGNRAIVGRIAKELALSSPADTVQYVKSFIGRRRKRFSLGGQEWTPEELSAMILKKVVRDAEMSLGGSGSIHRAVITVPAFFSEQQRKSTRDAGRIAGLEVLGMINEPTAAALAYGFHELGKDQTILVYDLGGGTFDITIMRIEGESIKMLATDGDVQLGGKDWDQRIIDYLGEEFMQRNGIDPREHADSLQELVTHAEQAKVRLSRLPETRIAVNCEGIRETFTLTRDQFDEMTADLVSQTETTMRLTLQEADLEVGEIDSCLCVGGSTRLPAIQAMFERLTGQAPRHVLNPDECVAQGAAIHALMAYIRMVDEGSGLPPPKVRSESLEKFRRIEEHLINAHTLGIKAMDRKGNTVVAPVIPRGAHVPCRQLRTFQTSRDGQDTIRIAVMEGENPNPEGCTEIGTCFVRDLPANLAHGTPIEVLFEYSQDSQLKVSATLPTIQQSVQAHISRTAGMSREEIETARERLARIEIH
jgi:molecular chaperone DnaK